MQISRLASSWALLSTALATPLASSPIELETDVVIIGGGSAGIHAAISLKDAGARVLVVERKCQIGGNAETYTNPETHTPANVGVVLFENTEIVSNYFARLGVPTAKSDPLAPQPGAVTKSYDFSVGVAIPEQNASSADQEAVFQAAGISFVNNVLAKYLWIDDGFLVPDPVPEELTIPFGELAAKYNFTALLPIAAQFNWFTGGIASIPALYGIKSLGPGLLQSLQTEFIVSGTGDTRALYDAAAKELGDSILLEATVVNVNRNDTAGVSLTVTQPGQPPKYIRGKKLLIAAPPTIENVGTYDLCETERSLFSQFSSLGYLAGVVTVPGLNNTLQNVGLQTPFNQPVIPGTNGIYTAGSPGDFLFGVAFQDTNYTDEDGKNIIRKNLETLAAVGAVPKDAAETVTFPYVSNHAPYNVRVSADQIKQGFYGKLLALEGQRNTYWAGAAFSGHNSGLVWTFNNGTVLPALKKDLGL
ncbi:Beta-cyclopiazonate dehydrogenase [Colletotrichum sidae]|uniref:Beta-cyclopiazonate dehydrogenase n=1 Tax=Colletotrichum sidae TaxID=1347389 RepID=A0A4R8TK64_9PEZI|nr:Beta-cyclopiazonate dehydrogenase [Colletotrichum sidae]